MRNIRTYITAMLLIAIGAQRAQAQETDRFGRDKDEKVTSGGLAVQFEGTSLIINNVDGFSSRPGFGLSVGGFVDFKVTEKFVIQCNILANREQSSLFRFDRSGTMTTYGMAVPICFLARFDRGDRGIWYVGGGPYSEFVLGCRTDLGNGVFNPYTEVVGTDAEGNDIFALSNNNSGLNVKLIYEFPFHLQLTFGLSGSITDILGYDHTGCWIRPARASIGAAYRFR
ncbi:MAG: hypothetical protein ACI395_03880 [Candidatus Cryptobacteroides sp.]